MVNSRVKGRVFEYQVRNVVVADLGLKCTRNIEQVRLPDQGDLDVDHRRFPTLECKRRAQGLFKTNGWSRRNALMQKLMVIPM